MHELFDWIYSIVVALFIAMIIHISFSSDQGIGAVDVPDAE